MFPALPPGIYALTVEAAGFRKTAIADIQLVVSGNVAQDIVLEVGQVSETIEVKANVVAVSTTDAQISAAVTMADINVLPQIGRAPISLSYFQPGVQIAAENGTNAGADYSYSRINGLRQGSNNNTLDGIDVNDAVAPRLGLAMTANNSDSVEEFRLVSAAGKAEYGRNAGGQTELVTRSGTNTYHGGLYEYMRNTALNANDFFSNKSGIAKPMFIQNMYGGSFGGPIRHNRLFIFGNYQGRRTHQQISRNRTVPTDLAKQGIFQWVTGGATQQFNVLNQDPRNKGIDPTIATLLKIYPSPNNTDVGDGLNSAGYRFNNPNNSLEDQFTIKGDYNFRDNHHFFFRDSWQRNSSIDSLNNTDANFPGQPQGTQGGHRWGIATGWDWTISPSLVNQFRYGHQSASVAFLRPSRVAGMMYTFNNSWTMPILNSFAQGRNSPVNEYTDNLTKIKGNHTIKVGGQIRFTTQWGTNDAGIYPNASLSTTSTGNTPPFTAPAGLTSSQVGIVQGLYNNLLGRVGSIAQTFYSDLQRWQAPGTPRVRTFMFHEYGGFIQDDWKASRNLTFNVGLRYDFSGVPAEQNGLVGTLDQVANLNTSSQIDNLTIKKGGQWYGNDSNNFAPRFGFAWDVKGDGKTAIRGNYGIFYDRVIGAATSSADSGTPGFSQAMTSFPNAASTATTDVRIADGLTSPAQPAAPVLTLASNRSTTITVFNPNLRTGYVEQWGLNIQREIRRDTVLQVGYVANRALKLFMNQDLDQIHWNPTFQNAYTELANNYNAGTLANVPASNPFVKIYGTASAAVTGLGASNLQTLQYSNSIYNMETGASGKYAAAGISEYALRNYPQYYSLRFGTNTGLSWYNSLQVSLRRQTKSMRIAGNYTWSKAEDNVTTEGNGFTDTLDNYNMGLYKARANFDRPHVFSMQATYTLPIGKGHALGGNMPRWANTLIGGWDIGGLAIWESGNPINPSSLRYTSLSYYTPSFYNYSSTDRNIGSVMRKGDGVYFIDPALISRFSFPGVADYGNAGRNTFRGPRFFNADASLVKSFAITEHKRIAFRAEAYNLFNNVDFANPSMDLSTPSSFGKIANVVNSGRIMQGALRFDF